MSLIAFVRTLQDNGTTLPVQTTEEAAALLNAFGDDCHRLRRDMTDDVTSECYGRSHLTALKLAALAAVAANFEKPSITVEMASWGIAQSRQDVATLLDAAHGKLGIANSETDHDVQAAYVLKKIVHWTTSKFEDLPKGYSQTLHAAKFVPWRYLSHQCKVTAAFKNDIDATRALKRAVDNLIAEESIARVEPEQLKFHNITAECFILTDASAL